MTLAVVLNVGTDAALMDIRSTILQAAGYMVESTLSPKEAVDRLLTSSFDAVILSHSISALDIGVLAGRARELSARAPLVAIADDSGHCTCFAEAGIDHGAHVFLENIEELLVRSTSSFVDDAKGDDGKGTNSMSWRQTLLCVDDDCSQLMLRREILEKAGYLVLTALNAEIGVKIFSSGIVDAVVLDYVMPHTHGAAVAAQMRRIKKDVPIVLLSGCLTIPEEEIVLFDRFVRKSDPSIVLLSAIKELLCRGVAKGSGLKSVESEAAIPLIQDC
jgi:DNA-binding response OmpR family regulator